MENAKSHFIKLFNYEYWANEKILTSLLQKPLLNKKAELLFSHMLSAQITWLSRCEPFAYVPNIWQVRTLEEVETDFELYHKKWMTFLNHQQNEDFEKIIIYLDSKGIEFKTVMQDILTHLINHSSYHRGQIVQLLKEERDELPATDFILWIRTFKYLI